MTPELLNGDVVGLVQEEVRSRRGMLGSVRGRWGSCTEW
jgi:hypothetical protein